MILHPTVGLHFVHVVSSAWGPFVDIWAYYDRQQSKRDYLSLISAEHFVSMVEGTEMFGDATRCYVLWDPFITDLPLIGERESLVVPVYSEAFSYDASKMLDTHHAVLNRFRSRVDQYDAVFVHTPAMATAFMSLLPAYVLPVGYDPLVMGEPRFGATKHTDYGFHGSKAGKRKMVIPFLAEELGSTFVDLSGDFGRRLVGSLDNCKASLYIAHSDVDSFSTWRLWQAFSTSAALVAEPGDCWPAEPGRHLVSIPPITLDNGKEVVQQLRDIARTDLSVIAAAAHEEIARKYTVDNCIDEYLIPAGQKIWEAKQRR